MRRRNWRMCCVELASLVMMHISTPILAEHESGHIEVEHILAESTRLSRKVTSPGV